MTFEEAFEDISFSTTMTYLSKMGNQSEEYRTLEEKSLQIYRQIIDCLSDKDLLDTYDELETAMSGLYLRWTYQKALRDYSVLLSKLGILLPDLLVEDDTTEEVPIEKEAYESLVRMAKKRNVSIDFLATQCLEYIMDHPEEMTKALKK